MRRYARLIVVLLVLSLGLIGVPAAFGESPSERNCAGTFDRTRGEVSCTVLDPVGQSEHSGGQSQSTTEEESSNGTLQNRPHHQESCTGPGGSGEDGGPCHNK